jgi:hypothetical protein
MPGIDSAGAPDRSAAPGASITVRGAYWAAECNDTVVCGTGCGGGSCTGGEPSPPERDLRVTLVPLDTDQGAALLAEGVDADARTFRFRTTVTLPTTLVPGRYRIVVGNDHAGDHRTEPITVSPA